MFLSLLLHGFCCLRQFYNAHKSLWYSRHVFILEQGLFLQQQQQPHWLPLNVHLCCCCTVLQNTCVVCSPYNNNKRKSNFQSSQPNFAIQPSIKLIHQRTAYHELQLLVYIGSIVLQQIWTQILLLLLFLLHVVCALSALNVEAQTNLKCKRAKQTFAISRVLNIWKEGKTFMKTNGIS